MEISAILQVWYDHHKRILPWRQTSDPYAIWLSEIILQQTRVAQGIDYYRRFLLAFPSISDLAAASEDEVLKLWQGLGYYSRARNLHKCAQMVGSTFPSNYAQLIQLPGIGPYTAAAIASFASDENVPVVDGNVYRVLARLFDIDTPIDKPAGQKVFLELARQLLDSRHPGRHNQAIMEFGALQCTPTSPKCSDCPLSDKCLALANHTVEQRPVKAGKIKIRERSLHYYIYKYENTLWVHKRGSGDIWQGLWEPYLQTEVEESQPEGVVINEFDRTWVLTHQRLKLKFSLIELREPNIMLPDGYCRISWDEWQKKAVPQPISEANEKICHFF